MSILDWFIPTAYAPDEEMAKALYLSAQGNLDLGSACVTCPNSSECPKEVKFIEYKTKYGFDDRTDPIVPWLSVEKGESTTIKAIIRRPGRKFANVEFISSDEQKVTVTPAKATKRRQKIEVCGIAKGEVEVTAECNGTVLGSFKVKTYERVTKSVAVRLVHEKGDKNDKNNKHYKSTDVSKKTIEDCLKKVYEQAVVEFEVAKLPAKAVDFDLNNDKHIDVDDSKPWMPAEMAKIRDACKDENYDYNIFLVDNSSDDTTGYMKRGQSYGFVHADNSSHDGATIAHELGHGAFSLKHPKDETPADTDDTKNIMYYASRNKWRLRKRQWDQINNK